MVRGVRRDPPDLRKLSRAVIALALAEMEAENGPVANPETGGSDGSQQGTDQSASASEPSPDTADGEVRP